MITLTQFTPQVNQNFAFLPTLDGQQYSAVVTWSLFGQRWIFNLYTLQQALVVSKPLVASPLDADINIIQGYGFTSTVVYREASNNFEVT